MLTVENIECYYGRLRAVHDLSLSVAEAELVSVIGSNGAGKSTLLAAVTGINHARRGQIIFNGEDITRMQPAQIVKRGISLVPEGRRIFGPLTVRENLVMGSYIRRRKGERAAIDKDMERIFQSFPVLHDRAEQLAGSLSGGEQQMLAIGRALMNRPRFLLLDEPSMGLAPLLVKEIFNVLSELKSTKTTILLVEQNARIALQICDRAYVLERGRMALEGTRGELLDNPTIKKAYLGE